MLFLRSLIDFPSTFHRICIEFASALQRRIIGGTLEDHWRYIGESCLADILRERTDN